jgi:hypothetical protein
VSTFSASDVSITVHGKVPLLPVVAVAVPSALAVLCLYGGAEEYLPQVITLVMIEAVVFLLSPALFPEGALGPPRERVALRADRTGVYVKDARVVDRAAIASAAIERHSDGSSRVILLGEGVRSILDVSLSDDARARAMLSALGLDADRSTASFVVERAPLVRAWRQWIGVTGRVVGSFALLWATFMIMRRAQNEYLLLAYPPALVLFHALAWRLRGRARVVVGADGVALRVGRRVRVVPHALVRDVRRVTAGAEMSLVTGEIIELRVPGSDDGADTRCDALVHRLEEGRAVSARGQSDHAAAAMLARGGRSIDAWMRDLASVCGRTAASYRMGAVPEERLWSIALDPSAPPSARAGAAVALSSSLDAEARERLRAAADASARPSVRVVLQAAAEGSAELAAALESLDARDDEETDGERGVG